MFVVRISNKIKNTLKIPGSQKLKILPPKKPVQTLKKQGLFGFGVLLLGFGF